MNIDHIAIWTNDLELEKSFYLKYFNCKACNLYNNPQKKFSSYFLEFSDGCRIELMKRDGEVNPPKLNTAGYTHMAINVGTRDNVDQLTLKLRSDGHIIISNPRVTGDGYYESVIEDPEGNAVELTAMEDFKISDATEKDIETILFLQKCCYLSEGEIYGEYNIPPLMQTLEEITRELKEQTILKLEFKNRIIGSIRAYIKNDTCYVGRIIVNREYQNRGLGRKLLLSIEERFKDAKRFELFTGNRSERNLYLYKKCGYVEFKEEQHGNLIFKFLEKLNK